MADTPGKINQQKLAHFLSLCRIRRLSARNTIIYAGESSTTLFYIVRGSVSVLIQDDKGHEMVVTYLNKGEFFGEMGLFDLDNLQQDRSARVRTRTECELAEISYTQFHELTHEDPELLYALCRQMAERLRKTTRKACDLANLDVTGRIARTLLELTQQPDSLSHPDGMQIKVSRQEVARLVGCSREMVGRVLKNLEDQNLITVDGKTIVVYNSR
ncbi:cAMP-activated global transcriptional regulator CRP [Halopseudomonas salegens]|uniref:CRP/FNR family transcriptional regulator, cyclic AMP receptor protein n=1 Tax=Halopseudomonas salegens TaxID=1434072 RepID=A0A1H2DZE1_9GAMM|nr:cAMP-activated global transcriptional regulator CRP [Halopseudomonas salegens]SDT88242.1 CRP/FNR family transcriptional regulator, cyclic AMP receptor protein [Halopseudomonas salegens]